MEDKPKKRKKTKKEMFGGKQKMTEVKVKKPRKKRIKKPVA